MLKTITYDTETHILIPLVITEELIQTACVQDGEGAFNNYQDWYNSHSSGIVDKIRGYIEDDYKTVIGFFEGNV
jgi:hypothetical protein